MSWLTRKVVVVWHQCWGYQRLKKCQRRVTSSTNIWSDVWCLVWKENHYNHKYMTGYAMMLLSRGCKAATNFWGLDPVVLKIHWLYGFMSYLKEADYQIFWMIWRLFPKSTNIQQGISTTEGTETLWSKMQNHKNFIFETTKLTKQRYKSSLTEEK